MSWMLSIGTFGVGTFGGGRGKGFGLITDTPTFGRQGSAGTSYLRWATWQKLKCERNGFLSSNAQVYHFCKHLHKCISKSALKKTFLVLRSNRHMQHTWPSGLSERFWEPHSTSCNLAMALDSISEECTLSNHRVFLVIPHRSPLSHIGATQLACLLSPLSYFPIVLFCPLVPQLFIV